MKTSWRQEEAAGCIHLPFQDLTKLVTGFCACSVLGRGCGASFPMNRMGERTGRGRGKGGKERERDLFLPSQVSVNSALSG